MFFSQVSPVNIYFLIIDVDMDETAFTKKKLDEINPRKLVAEGSYTFTSCGYLHLKLYE